MVLKMRPFSTIAFIAILSHYLAHAHQEPETEEEIGHYLDAQRSIYHCYPDILSQVEQRKLALLKRGAAQQHPWVDQSTPSSKFDTLQFGSDDPPPIDSPSLDHNPSRLICSSQNPDPSSLKFKQVRNSTCVLSPTVRAGPYYHREGHPIRQSLAEWQEGLPLSLDIGVIDVETCQPVRGALVDIWHANATGFYAGHPTPAEGFENEKPQVGGSRAGLLTAYPRTLFDEQWLRGAWPTDNHGVARFNTIFPGYYTGRATHIHAEVHVEWERTKNGTFRSKDVQYIGQFFFDDEVNMSVDKMWPYTQNPVAHRTRNWRDSLKIFQESSATGFQPTLDIVKIGSVINQGLVGFITIGINLSHHYDHILNPTKSDLDL